VSRRLGKGLPRSFYLRPTLQVARSLLGKYIVRKYRGKTLAGKIVEVEAYIGPNDPASHAYRGMTQRNEVMFREGGCAYVYFTYGMHYCFNIATEREGYPAAVLIRAVEPVEGIETMKRLRRTNDVMNLASGPAKFCQAFRITKNLNKIDLTGDEIFLTYGERIPSSKIGTSPRIGIKNGTEKKWRFYVKRNRYISK
jgi:DNA-3-methyladenine glycosylase